MGLAEKLQDAEYLWDLAKKIKNHPWFTGFITTIVPTIGAILKDLEWPVVFVIFLLALLVTVKIIAIVVDIYDKRKKRISLELVSKEETEEENIQFSQPEAITAPYLNGHNFHIYSLIRHSNTIQDRTFENCHIYGPAIMAFINPNVTGVQIQMANDDPDSILIDIGKNIGKPVMGIIAFKDCYFKNCHFYNIGIIGTVDMLEQIRKAFPQKIVNSP